MVKPGSKLLSTVFALVISVVQCPIATAADAVSFIVRNEGTTFSVDVSDVPLMEVLVQLQEQCGFTFVENSSALDLPVSIKLESVLWRDGLQTLLRGFRYALAMDLQKGQPETLVILSEETGVTKLADEGIPNAATVKAVVDSESGNGMPDRSKSSIEEANRIAEELASQQEDPLQYAMRKAKEAQAAIEEAMEQAKLERARRAAGGEDIGELDDSKAQIAYKTYAEALRALGEFQDAARMEVLAPALNSDNAMVRSAALDAMRDGTVYDADVLNQVLSLAIRDTDVGVQRGALEVYVRYADQADVLSLVQAIARAEGPTRDIAVREWLRIENEIADAALADAQLNQAR